MASERLRAGLWVAAEGAWSLLPDFSGGAALGIWLWPPGFWPVELSVSVHPDAGTDAEPGATFLSFVSSLLSASLAGRCGSVAAWRPG